MRAAIPLLLLALAACNREPSFDQRYEAMEKAIHKKAAEIDAELAEQNARVAEAAARPTAAVTPPR